MLRLLYSNFVLKSCAILLCSALVFGACGSRPGSFPIPPQRAVAEGRDPGEYGNFIRMGDPYADEHIIKDVTSEKADWRWTFVRPELKLRVTDVSSLRFVMEFAIPEVTFRSTGPVVVSCFVNDKPLGSMPCPKPGKYRFEKPVPQGWVQPDSVVMVRAEVNKRWVSKEDGAQLGFLLGAIGFPPQR